MKIYKAKLGACAICGKSRVVKRICSDCVAAREKERRMKKKDKYFFKKIRELSETDDGLSTGQVLYRSGKNYGFLDKIFGV